MATRIDELSEVLSLAPVEGSEDEFRGLSHWMMTGRVFGGQIVAQGLQAAALTVPDGRLPHSLHGYFLRAGDTQYPVDFQVERLHDGNSFSARRAQAAQQGVPIFSMIASFQTIDDGAEHSLTMPFDITPPEDLDNALEQNDILAALPPNQWSQFNCVDLRYVQSPLFFTVKEREPRQQVWIRITDDIEPNQIAQRVALAYATDYAIMEPVLRVHNSPWMNPNARTASLDHAIWFHRDVNVNEWLLYDVSSPTSQGGRGLCEARIWNRSGALVATVAQEAMLRLLA